MTAKAALARSVGPDRAGGDFTFINQSITPEDTPYRVAISVFWVSALAVCGRKDLIARIERELIDRIDWEFPPIPDLVDIVEHSAGAMDALPKRIVKYDATVTTPAAEWDKSMQKLFWAVPAIATQLSIAQANRPF